MVIESTPSTPFDVPKVKLLFEILVATLDAPMHHGKVNRPLHRRTVRQR